MKQYLPRYVLGLVILLVLLGHSARGRDQSSDGWRNASVAPRKIALLFTRLRTNTVSGVITLSC